MLYPTNKYLHKELTDKIIKCFFKSYNKLGGYEYLEKLYETALCYELYKIDLLIERQKPIKVHYEDLIIGDFFADIVVNNKVIIEIKAVETICEEHELQLINYLKATDMEVGLLLNYGKKPEVKRKIFSNFRKHFITDNLHD